MAKTNKGWIKLHRSIMDHWIYEDYKYLHYWIDMLLLANHEDGKKLIYRKLVTIKAGQFLTSRRKLAERWHIDKDTVGDTLNTFVNDGMIIVENRYNGTLITIVNYGAYQGFKGKNTDTDSDTLSDTLSDAYWDTDSDTVSDADSDAVSPLTRITKNNIKNDIKNDKESKKTAPRYDPGGYEIEE